MRKFIVVVALTAGMSVGIIADRLWREQLKASTEKPLTMETLDIKKGSPALPRDTVKAPADGFDPAYVQTEVAASRTIPDTIPVSGKFAFSASQMHLASSRVSGRLDKILVFEGSKVKAGQPLAELYSPDFISAENEYLLARNTVRTLEKSGNKDLLNDAKATEESAINKLKVLGANEEDVENLEKKGVASSHLIVRAPISGVVVKRNMDPGAFLNIGDAFMSIADTGKLWFYAYIYENDYANVKLGQELQLEASALPGKLFKGNVDFVAPSIDPTTHVLSIRCEVLNPLNELRPEMFATGGLCIGHKRAVIVPKTALIQIKDAGYVIVDRGKGLYQRLPVTAANLKDNKVAVFSGLNGGEHLVVKGTTLINNLIVNQQG